MLVLNSILLALVWAAITGSFSPANIVFGFALGAVALSIIREQAGSNPYFMRPLGVMSLAILFIRELIVSAWRVARLVMSPRMDLKPGIFAYPLKVDRDFEITLLANLITLTPGTLSVDVSEDRRVLFVHAIDCADAAATIREIEQGFERKILEAFRR
jgi:multicomponent Na+:H+ antiporter subunit E